VWGCAGDGVPDAELNTLKNARGRGKAPKPLSLDDFESLQAVVRAPQGFAIQDRSTLTHLVISVTDGANALQRSCSEGDWVSTTGFIIGTPYALHHDPGSCFLEGEQNNTIVVHLARRPTDLQFSSIIVELRPRRRNLGWSLVKLHHVAHASLPVRVEGRLLYDNTGLVNANPEAPVQNEPQRFSLWEIHPVTTILVCSSINRALCQGSGGTWIPLEDLD